MKLSEKQERYLATRRRGFTVLAAAEECKISKHTCYVWRRASWFKKLDDASLADGPTEQPDTAPVDVLTFARDPAYLGLTDMWPSNLELLQRFYAGEYWCLVMRDSIGGGKTRLGAIIAAYETYRLSTLGDAHEYFGLGRSGTIVLAFTSRTTGQSRDAGFAAYKRLVSECKYFATRFPATVRRDRLIFHGGIEARSTSAHPHALLGQDLIFAFVDEADWGASSEQSVRAADGGRYVQAAEQVASIRPRMTSRYQVGSTLHAKLVVASSPRSVDDFSEELAKEAETDRGILVSRRPLWQIKTDQFDATRTFPVFVGDRSRPARVLDTDETIIDADRELVLQVPSDLRRTFERDIRRALMDIAAIPVEAAGAFLTDRAKLGAAFVRKSILNREAITSGEGVIVHTSRITSPELPRFAHVDLSKNRDSTGLAVGHVSRWETIKVGDTEELRPRIVIDLALAIRPPRGGEIDAAQIRRFLYAFRDHVRLDHVGADQFGWSMLQELSRQGFRTSLVSVDRTNEPYDHLRELIGDGAIELPENATLLDELLGLEAGRDKIDHRPGRSKDVADAVCGVAWVLSRSRILAAEYGVLESRGQIRSRVTMLGGPMVDAWSTPGDALRFHTH